MDDKRLKGTGKYWLDKGSLSGQVEIGNDKIKVNVRNGEEIPEGLLPAGRLEKFEEEGKVGKIVAAVNSNQEIVNLRKQVKDLSAQLKEAQKPQAPAGDESDKVKKLNDKLEAAELANEEISAENEAIKNAIAKLSEEYPELETKLQEIIEADTEDEGLIGKLGKMFSRK